MAAASSPKAAKKASKDMKQEKKAKAAEGAPAAEASKQTKQEKKAKAAEGAPAAEAKTANVEVEDRIGAIQPLMCAEFRAFELEDEASKDMKQEKTKAAEGAPAAEAKTASVKASKDTKRGKKAKGEATNGTDAPKASKLQKKRQREKASKARKKEKMEKNRDERMKIAVACAKRAGHYTEDDQVVVTKRMKKRIAWKTKTGKLILPGEEPEEMVQTDGGWKRAHREEEAEDEFAAWRGGDSGDEGQGSTKKKRRLLDGINGLDEAYKADLEYAEEFNDGTYEEIEEGKPHYGQRARRKNGMSGMVDGKDRKPRPKVVDPKKKTKNERRSGKLKKKEDKYEKRYGKKRGSGSDEPRKKNKNTRKV